MKRAYAADFIMNALERLHPKFYPQPSRQILDDKGKVKELQPITSNYLTKEDLIKLNVECGNILHRGNMRNLNRSFSAAPSFTTIASWAEKITTLLSHHQIALFNSTDQVWVVMRAADGKSHAALAKLRRPNPDAGTE